MSKTLQKFFILVTLINLLFLFIPAFVYAGDQPSQPSGGLKNPLGDDVTDPRVIIGNVIKAGLGIVGSLALVVFILGGFTWVTAAGNDEKIKKGKDMIIWASLGLAVIFASYALVTFVIGALTGT